MVAKSLTKSMPVCRKESRLGNQGVTDGVEFVIF